LCIYTTFSLSINQFLDTLDYTIAWLLWLVLW
jgi:hypothetical protein